MAEPPIRHLDPVMDKYSTEDVQTAIKRFGDMMVTFAARLRMINGSYQVDGGRPDVITRLDHAEFVAQKAGERLLACADLKTPLKLKSDEAQS